MVQDYIIAGVQAFFCVNLLPMVFAKSGRSTPLLSSGTTVAGLIVMAGTLFSIPLFFGGVTTLAIAVAWVLLAYQRIEFFREQLRDVASLSG